MNWIFWTLVFFIVLVMWCAWWLNKKMTGEVREMKRRILGDD
jgi:hypothetical protein